MSKKRTYGFDDYIKKVSEGIDEVGFKRYVQEHEEENKSVDDLGAGEQLETPSTGEEATPSEPTTEPTDEKNPDDSLQPIDTGNRDDINIEDIETKMEFINGYFKSLSSLIMKAKDNLDKETKQRVINLYNIIQGIK